MPITDAGRGWRVDRALEREPGNGGFTLVEVIAVTVILAMFAVAAMLTVQSSLENAGRTLFVDRLRTIDSQLRIQANRQPDNSYYLIFDLDSRQLKKIDSSSNVVVLADDIPVDRVSSGYRIVQAGQISIPYKRGGICPSFAVRTTERDLTAGWLFVAGGSGQFLEYDNESQVEELLLLPQVARSYAR